jgi:hypothetical protein
MMIASVPTRYQITSGSEYPANASGLADAYVTRHSCTNTNMINARWMVDSS